MEKGICDGEEVERFLIKLLEPIKCMPLDGVVLGCTHYSFLAKTIRKCLNGVKLYDGNEGTARQLKRVLAERDLLSSAASGSVQLFTSGDSQATIPVMEKLLATPISI